MKKKLAPVAVTGALALGVLVGSPLGLTPSAAPSTTTVVTSQAQLAVQPKNVIVKLDDATKTWCSYDKTTGQKVTYTGLAQNDSGWWYVDNGTVNFKFNGFAGNEYGSWFVEKGKVSFYYTGKVVCNDTLFHVTKGKVISSELLSLRPSIGAVGATTTVVGASNKAIIIPGTNTSGIVTVTVPAGVLAANATATTVKGATTAKNATTKASAGTKTTTKTTKSTTTEYIEVITDPPTTTTKATTKSTSQSGSKSLPTTTKSSGSSSSSSSGSSSSSSGSNSSSSSASSSSSSSSSENETPIVSD